MRAGIVLLLALALSACDEAETVISHVDRRGHVTLDDLWTMQDGRGVPVEVHGSPFDHVSDRELAEALRPPAAASQVTFYARPAGGWMQGHPTRLVLHFNPQGGPNTVRDCQLTGKTRTNHPPEGSFTVNASFCQGDDWHARGYLQATRVEDGDLEAFSDMMATLMLAMFREEKDR